MNLRPEDFRVWLKRSSQYRSRGLCGYGSRVFNYLCDTAMTAYGGNQLRRKPAIGAQIRTNSLHNLPELLEEFESNAV